MVEIQKKKRDVTVDAAKGLAMLIIIMSHCGWIVLHAETTYMAFPTNYMALPVFFGISGFFAGRRWRSGSVTEPATNFPEQHLSKVWKVCLKLSGVFLFWSYLWCLVKRVGISDYIYGSFAGYWFFVSLLVCFIITELIRYLCSWLHLSDKWTVRSLVLVWLLMLLANSRISSECMLYFRDDTCNYFPIYAFGWCIGLRKNMKKAVVTPLCAVAGLVAFLFQWIVFDEDWNMFSVVAMAGSFVAIWYLMVLVHKISRLRGLKTIGKHSLIIYGYHYFLLLILSKAGWYVPRQLCNIWWPQILICLVLAVIIAFIGVVLGRCIKIVKFAFNK